MLAAFLYGPQDVRFERIPIPVPGPGEVLVKVKAALTDATDVKTFRRGTHRMLCGQLPARFGHEFAGVAAAVGPGVERVREGMHVVAANSAPCGHCFYCRRNQPSLCEDLLFVNGAFAEYILVPARIAAANLYQIPEHVDFKHAAMAEPLACAVHAVEVAAVGLGDTVALNGGGAMGLILCYLLALKGARVILCDRYPHRLALARRFGASETVQLGADVDEVAVVKDLTEGRRGADVAIEVVGAPPVWESTIRMTRRGGMAMMFGGCAPGTTISVDTGSLHYDELVIRGLFHHTPRYVKTAVDLISNGQANIQALISDTLPLRLLPDALAGIARRQGFKYALEPEAPA